MILGTHSIQLVSVAQHRILVVAVALAPAARMPPLENRNMRAPATFCTSLGRSRSTTSSLEKPASHRWVVENIAGWRRRRAFTPAASRTARRHRRISADDVDELGELVLQRLEGDGLVAANAAEQHAVVLVGERTLGRDADQVSSTPP
ncbi:MAG: hypothetical protein H6924_09310 [Alphaproteobacteria bacterium]|nr:hypothetical protein [Alphaproteobacteria bacterium]